MLRRDRDSFEETPIYHMKGSLLSSNTDPEISCTKVMKWKQLSVFDFQIIANGVVSVVSTTYVHPAKFFRGHNISTNVLATV